MALWFSTGANEAAVYWSDRGAGQLKRMHFDGSGLSTITLSGAVTSPGSNIRGIAIHPDRNQLYWADNGADRLLRANADGSASLILHTITGGGAFPADVQLDFERGHFYWCDQTRNRIQRSDLEGGAMVDIITNAAATGPYFMDLDLSAGKIYWGDFDDGNIYRANLDGSSRERLLGGNNNTRGVKVDSTGAMLYWINRDDKKVHRCPLAAFANGPIALTNAAVETLYTGLDTPHGLAIDILARKLYWADTGSNAGTGAGDKAVSRGDFDGSGAMEVLATGSEPWDVDLDLRSQNYGEFRMRFFRKDAPPAQTDLAADPDSDGVKNALEYAFNLSPLSPGRSGLPAGFLATGPMAGGRYPAIKFRRRANATDLTYTVQATTNLLDWNSSAVATTQMQATPLGEGMEEAQFRTAEPLAASSTVFLRVQARLQ